MLARKRRRASVLFWEVLVLKVLNLHFLGDRLGKDTQLGDVGLLADDRTESEIRGLVELGDVGRPRLVEDDDQWGGGRCGNWAVIEHDDISFGQESR